MNRSRVLYWHRYGSRSRHFKNLGYTNSLTVGKMRMQFSLTRSFLIKTKVKAWHLQLAPYRKKFAHLYEWVVMWCNRCTVSTGLMSPIITSLFLFWKSKTSNFTEMYYHHTKLSSFVVFYLIVSNLAFYNFSGGGSSSIQSIPFESLECLLSRNFFKVLEDPPPLKMFWFKFYWKKFRTLCFSNIALIVKVKSK